MKKLTMILLTASANLSAFNNNGWKMDGDKIVLKDGNPVYLDTNGAEQTIDVAAMSRLRGEAQGNRLAKETAEKALEKFRGIDDPEKALKAIETLAKIDAKKLIDAGEVDAVKEQIKSQFTAQINELTSQLNTTSGKLNNLRIENVFAGSEFVRDRIALPRDIFESYFKNNFKLDDKGEIVAYGRDGNPLMSRKEIGSRPSHEEALELLVDMHPQKDIILKANSNKGSGNQGGGGNQNKGRVIKRSDFDQLPPQEQAKAASQQAAGEIQIVD